MARVLSAVLVAGCAAFLFHATDFTQPFSFVDRASRRDHLEWDLTSYAGVQVMNRLLPEGSIVGSWDAGVVGYFSAVPVVNLDGLMNTYEHLRALSNYPLRRYHGEDYARPLYRQYGITHFANGYGVAEHPDNLLFEGLKFTSYSGARRFKLWAKAPAGARAGGGTQAWESLEPLFDIRTEQVSFIIGDRLVQAFAQACNPTVFVVSWRDARGMRHHADYLWNEPTETSLGYCTEAFELPNDAVHPIGIAALGPQDFIDRLGESAQRIVSDAFDVHLGDGQLLYVRENCRKEDTEAWFFLHVVPVDQDDLPEHRRQYGFQNLDFRFADRVFIDGDHCIATRALPDYDIAAIRTGQYISGKGRLWEGRFDFAEPVGD